jgi:hypothetical protein
MKFKHKTTGLIYTIDPNYYGSFYTEGEPNPMNCSFSEMKFVGEGNENLNSPDSFRALIGQNMKSMNLNINFEETPEIKDEVKSIPSETPPAKGKGK